MGVVLDLNGNPIRGADVSAWFNDKLIDSVYSDSNGFFQLDADEIEMITVFADNNDTVGVDYIPVLMNVTAVNELIEFRLYPAATIQLTGDVQYVESEELPLSVIYEVINKDNHTQSPSGYPLVFGSKTGYGPFDNLHFAPGEVIVPSENENIISVNVSILINQVLHNRVFLIESKQISHGSKVTLDIRRFLLPQNLEIIDELKHGVEERLEEMSNLGFFLTKQYSLLNAGTRSYIDASDLLLIEEYTNSFESAKRSYIDLLKTSQELEKLYSDASSSVYILIFFLTLTSISIAQMLTNSISGKLFTSIITDGFFLSALYFVYPGSVIIPLGNFIGVGLLSLLSTLIFSLVLPNFLKGGSVDGHVRVRNIIVPIFSIAKRSLNRRSFRFFLTLLSITVLVMSFVSLTSFSEGYGLVINEISNKPIVEGLLVRDGSWSREEIAFIPYNDVEIAWLVNQYETKIVSAKFENLPQLTRLTTLNGYSIMGIISIDPFLEDDVLNLSSTLLTGSLIDEDGIIISDVLQNSLNLVIGDNVDLGENEFELQAVFDSKLFSELRDIDGDTYLPKKIVNQNQGGEMPILVTRECEPEEIVLIHISKAQSFPTLGIGRIGILPVKDVDEKAFAERLALERGYKVWASNEEGLILAQLGNYLEGKGLPLIIPWVIVVLNVVITMLNSLYERRNEISTLSSVGLNPAQISAIFIAEASIIGLIAGGAGYLLGLSSYKLMSYMGVTLEVHQKVSAFWSIASIGLAISAVLAGAVVALKSSVVITPSLTRKWRINSSETRFNEPLSIEIPVKLLPEEKNAFVDFVLSFLNKRRFHPVKVTSQIKLFDEEEYTYITFIYRSHMSNTDNFYTKNTLHIEQKGVVLSVRLESFGEVEWVHEVGSMVRMLAVEWSTKKN